MIWKTKSCFYETGSNYSKYVLKNYLNDMNDFFSHYKKCIWKLDVKAWKYDIFVLDDNLSKYMNLLSSFFADIYLHHDSSKKR